MLTYKNFAQYLKERFPLQQFIPLSLIFSLVAAWGIQFYLGTENLWAFVWPSLALWLFLFRLRLFDEFKDYDHDKEHYPDRPVVRGLIKLVELKKIVWLILILEVLISLSAGLFSLLMFVVAMFYSLLMFKEFFVAKWLKKHFTVYIASHEILLLPLFFYIFALSGATWPEINSPFFWYLFVFLGSQLFLLEVTRKFRPKDMEIASRDTYTAQYGIKGASILVTALSFAVLWSYIKIDLFFSTSLFYINFCICIVLMLFVYKFIKHPSNKGAKQVFNTSILFAMVADIVFIISLFI